jgi:hypothetical protein
MEDVGVALLQHQQMQEQRDNLKQDFLVGVEVQMEQITITSSLQQDQEEVDLPYVDFLLELVE